ncbi:DUF1064 domain-containing protein [Macrococcoides caseolyticum]|uniref:DUF1064 domain-containing protein n=1 Tax=Macrococcoides caseolyticum TaxID=69966 RepID=UPI000C34918A|nr:DUF1064 domain-containing protein [Macrococcus caseolyticus]PKE47262.1 hypothetical protein CW677_08780 [Macrococcus caseolyticus]TDM23350.1 DUF1064 domain-containing protein [Macrococcus caseolyticus]
MSKYNAKKVEYDGHIFDSIVERDYYIYLQRNRLIERIELQPRYELIPAFKKQRKMEYIADFEVTYTDGTTEVIDIKGMATETAKVKAKLFRYLYQDKSLIWICRAPKYYQEQHGTEWIEYEELKKVRRQRKKG